MINSTSASISTPARNTGGHDQEPSWDDAGNFCLMDDRRRATDAHHELGLEHIYKLRDREEAI